GPTWRQACARPGNQDPPSTDTGPPGKCPVPLGPDQAGPGDDGTGPPTLGGTPRPVGTKRGLVLKLFGHATVAVRRFGGQVVVGGGLNNGRSGQRVTITVTRSHHVAHR